MGKEQTTSLNRELRGGLWRHLKKSLKKVREPCRYLGEGHSRQKEEP